ncbi:MAG: polyprenyl synthetase family protein [Mariprofundus sp.]|nr:polyprenyl synthetase family protein [Mariprofundus sp.]
MQPPVFLADHAAMLEIAMQQMLDARSNVVSERLLHAMRYSLLAGGKRVRPALLLECYRACGGPDDNLPRPAMLAIEAIHTYSLIHDDLPCMDNDDLRRGKPTCHRHFDEATAVLAADALQALAFELLATSEVDPVLRLELIRKLTIAAGCQGMVGGQMMDMQAENNKQTDLLTVERIHLHKTGALLCWSCEAGALLADANEAQLQACSRYGKAVGLLFQIADDILDATSSSEELGKSAGKDAAQNKATYVSLLGLQQAKELSGEMLELALVASTELGKGGNHLNILAQYIMDRSK